ncbi:hypothetical protein NDU88_004394 [Pleurodeles waltl]|uniref:Uncharacterized protein n=1 Tax=Pleurodeles waltl TaxID=8319 RepID=A0AAV7LJQ0_PLEWA|nr:hypothetical protein NDU88_004394 [Pleurodeles waltl]
MCSPCTRARCVRGESTIDLSVCGNGTASAACRQNDDPGEIMLDPHPLSPCPRDGPAQGTFLAALRSAPFPSLHLDALVLYCIASKRAAGPVRQTAGHGIGTGRGCALSYFIVLGDQSKLGELSTGIFYSRSYYRKNSSVVGSTITVQGEPFLSKFAAKWL